MVAPNAAYTLWQPAAEGRIFVPVLKSLQMDGLLGLVVARLVLGGAGLLLIGRLVFSSYAYLSWRAPVLLVASLLAYLASGYLALTSGLNTTVEIIEVVYAIGLFGVLFEHNLADRQRLTDCRRRVNVLPLGAAALAGTTFPIDRERVARELGFDSVARNSLDAVSDRDFAIEFCAFGALFMVHLSRLCEELILWMNPRLGFISLPDRFCTGSSIMPQKKNPDVPELARGKCGRVVGHLMGLLTLMKSQPLAYNKDNQEDKEPLFDTVDTLKDTLAIFAELVPGITPHPDAMRRAASEGHATATDLADYLVKKGLPFRDAHEAVARAVRFAESPDEAASGFEAIKGRGVRAVVDGQEVHVGGPRLLEMLQPKLPDSIARFTRQAEEKGQSVVYLVQDGRVAAGFALADVIRPESREAVERLHRMGVAVAMLTGDSQAVAKAVAEELAIDQYFAEVLPEHKDQKVLDLQKQGKRVAMVGDGVNDAPALTRADVGIAIGSGTDVAVESAGIILVRSNPLDVVKIISLSRASYRKMIQNLAWATGYNVVALPLAAGVLAPLGILLSPALGAVFMSLSTVIVAINAQLLRREKIGA